MKIDQHAQLSPTGPVVSLTLTQPSATSDTMPATWDEEFMRILDEGFGSWVGTGRDDWAEEIRAEWEGR